MKENNCYYVNIIIDNEVLQSLSKNGPINDLFPEIEDTEDNSDNDDNNSEESISREFVPTLLSSPNKKYAITHTLDRMQNNDTPIMWPNIDGNPINEFQTPGYIVYAFLILYPTGDADLHSEHIRDIKPAKYFSHLLKYKDSRFARHPY